MASTFRKLDFAFCMRYHAHMMAVVYQIPFISFSMTVKTEQLMTDIGRLDALYKMPIDAQRKPTGIDVDAVLDMFDQVGYMKPPVEYKDYPLTSYQSFLESVVGAPRAGGVHDARDICTPKDVMQRVAGVFAVFFPKHPITLVTLNAPGVVAKLIGGDMSVSVSFLTQNILYVITGQPHTEYQYGMEQKMTSSTVNIVSEIDWVLKDWQSKLKPKSWPNDDEHTGPHDTPNPVHPNGVPTFKRVVPLSPSPNPHRAGWKYAMESIECYNDDVNGAVLFDDYIDRSFHWCYDLFESTGTIPYRRKWFGFIHHTLNTGTSPNNVGALFEKPLFLQSLDTCMLLITMSSALKADVIKLLAEHNKSHVKVINMIHPTLMQGVPLFNLEHYYQNEGVVNVGAWLRNPFSIYTLQLNPGVSKYALRGQSMDDNFAPEDFVVSGMSISRGVYTCYSVSDGSIVELNSSNRDVCFQNMCRNNKQTFIQSSLESLIAQVHSVQVIEHQNDEAYDRLLTAKVVFLDLIDAAAVNTVVECIVRNTPIIVNRLPALEEYLGQDYPLFYYDLSEVNNLLTRIPDAHQYLVSKSKAEFHVDTFRARFAEVLKALAGASILKLDPASLADRLSSLSLEPAPAMSNPRPLPEAFLKTFRAPVFTGKSRSSSVEDWLQQLEDYLDAAQVAPTHHIVAAKLCLKDQAYRWYRRQGFDEQSEGVFDDFKDRLRRRFGSPNAELIARDKLYSLVQRGSVTRYIEEFEDLSSQIEELGSADAMYLFQKGLKPKIREYIASNPDARKSLDVMMDVAENLDNVQYHGRQFYPQLAGGHRSHHVPARPPRPAPPARPMPEPMDVDVNAMEARGPPRSRFQQAATVSPKDRQKQEDLRHGSCFFCHRPGHQAKECPMKSGNGRPY
ncbi:uncharacterized protein BJ171DRAFT_625252 [Polychytrium aggregatum]|uniref:uncharacterized protein n=1 Tax=Polychytrium aggregatum TaxID=110093 RepID=UPI0022FE9B14|nr:uncharacterized protein BJ171DRAFT_625252 [Polychytrium aggregatum]KAI9188472.1 hypothetical protein BJ171DRAFT_625252 [Polychytrium aggregatum]